MSDNKKIFISIASYRDPELLPTLQDMVKQADNTEHLHIAICWQHDNEGIDYFVNAGMTLLDSEVSGEQERWRFQFHNALIDVLSIHYYLSQGACWARHCSETFYANERYFMQIDSHCRFNTGWDTSMATLLESLRSQSPKPVLSGYPPAYEPGNEQKKAQKVNRLIFREFNAHNIVMLKAMPFEGDSPVRGCYLAGGFIFADGAFVKEVPNDPQIFFAGEEIAMSARAFTHGYDVYYPHILLIWHYYGRRQHNKVWSDHNSEAKAAGLIETAWWEKDKLSKYRVRSLFGLESQPADLGRFTLGTQRTLKELELHAGVFFQRRAVLPAVIGKDRIGFFSDQSQVENDLFTSVIYPNQKKIVIPAGQLDISREDIAWWHIGIYDKQNTLLEKIEVDKNDVASLFKQEGDDLKIDIEFSSLKLLKPHAVRICPYINTQGWGETIERMW
ncbi:GlcNAc-transferase family protein [Atlantibacter sp. RC6]|uniref:GlcNAc-transferase family protein n=1 Tax=Atlantibacter sp. RC6 TaxID=2587036 RepID=UPI0016068231|nr:GlcNAc-transferase family protein [Atlantibacter sp. RC6]MBB3324720.1 hypothetical protein [Atlantibacter sp. RC6]